MVLPPEGRRANALNSTKMNKLLRAAMYKMLQRTLTERIAGDIHRKFVTQTNSNIETYPFKTGSNDFLLDRRDSGEGERCSPDPDQIYLDVLLLSQTITNQETLVFILKRKIKTVTLKE